MTDRKVALITGIGGQDGSFLAELLLAKGYEVHGLLRPRQLNDPSLIPDNISHIASDLRLHPGILETQTSIEHAIALVRPSECYHLAGPSFVDATVVEEPAILAALVGGTHMLLSAIKETVPDCRFFLAGSSEMFGSVSAAPQDENTPFNPRSIYGLAKLSAHQLAGYYRSFHNLYTATAFLYNHESTRRGLEFLPRKLARGVARIKSGLQAKLPLGNLDAERDWGYAPEYVEAMWLMLQQKEPDDFVIATGQMHTVRELVTWAFESVDLDYAECVEVDPRYVRPSESVALTGDITKISKALGWSPKTPLKEVIEELVANELSTITRGYLADNPNQKLKE
ncbi:MAG: NAD-dependent epimerase/dehydratase family protein [Alphaproteobacteria bacterium]|nr:NAD-dependent epimerase/dehydratase family protein [Alphaproteobacteria bacterium]